MRFADELRSPPFKPYAEGSMEAKHGPAWVGTLLSDEFLAHLDQLFQSSGHVDVEGVTTMVHRELESASIMAIANPYPKGTPEMQLMNQLRSHMPLLATVPGAVRASLSDAYRVPIEETTSERKMRVYFYDNAKHVPAPLMDGNFAAALRKMRGALPMARDLAFRFFGRFSDQDNTFFKRVLQLSTYDHEQIRVLGRPFSLPLYDCRVKHICRAAAESVLQCAKVPRLADLKEKTLTAS